MGECSNTYMYYEKPAENVFLFVFLVFSLRLAWSREAGAMRIPKNQKNNLCRLFRVHVRVASFAREIVFLVCPHGIKFCVTNAWGVTTARPQRLVGRSPPNTLYQKGGKPLIRSIKASVGKTIGLHLQGGMGFDG
jgi:hypothetical protein